MMWNSQRMEKPYSTPGNSRGRLTKALSSGYLTDVGMVNILVSDKASTFNIRRTSRHY